MARACAIALLLTVASPAFWADIASAKGEDCPVCHSVMTRFTESLSKDDKKDQVAVEQKLQTFCDKMPEGKDSKFCYYITGATSLKREISKPIQSGFPADAICKKLGKLDPAICELTYKKTYKFNLVEMKEDEIGRKRIKDLRAMIQERGKECIGCIEKPDFVAEVLKLRAEEAAAKTEL